jgi:TetR/AcrR family transcriptional repressor of nem operon
MVGLFMRAKGLETREKLLAAAEALILQHGYAGMSLDSLLQQTGLTKGAFFHHFSGKGALAQAVVERYAERDFELFSGFAERADRLSDDPLERVLIFLRLFEEYLDGLGGPFPGCVFASYTYESLQFGPEVQDYIRQSLAAWNDLCEERFAALIAARAPVAEITARQLAEILTSLIEGGFIMANAMDDATWTQRQIAQFRLYLTLLFRDDRA